MDKRKDGYFEDSLAKCDHCGYWSVIGHPCYKCGAAISSDENYMYQQLALATCSHCGQWAAARSECKTCGAPVDPPYEHVLVNPSPYFMDGGVSFRSAANSVWKE